MEIFNCEQGTPEWFECRRGIPTASRFKDVMSKGRSKNVPSKVRSTYIMELASERITGVPMATFSTRHTDRGNEFEADARNGYSFLKDVDVGLVGFFKNGDNGASPDGLVGDNGQIEIKTKLADLHLSAVISNSVPAEHIKQVQGQLLVTEREWCDFVSFWPGLPLFIKRMHRDEDIIKEISEALKIFNDELNELETKIKGM